MNEIKKFAEVIKSLSNDYLNGNTSDDLFINMIDATVNHMKSLYEVKHQEPNIKTMKERIKDRPCDGCPSFPCYYYPNYEDCEDTYDRK